MKRWNDNRWGQLLKSHFAFLLLFVLILILAMATVVAKKTDQATTVSCFYNTFWFVCLWILLVVVALFSVFKSRKKKVSSSLIHLALGVIVCGAVVTWLTGESGYLHLREGRKSAVFMDRNWRECYSLPFQIEFEQFTIKNTSSSTVENYLLTCKIYDNSRAENFQISINKPIDFKDYKLLLTSYDDDRCGVNLVVNYDPVGSRMVYAGFLLLVVGMIIWIFSKRQVVERESRIYQRKGDFGKNLLTVFFFLFTSYLVCRIFAGNRLPLANGMEVSFVVLWFMQFLALWLSRKYRLMTGIGWLIFVAIFSLFVFGQMNLNVEVLQPVLRSPFLVVHVLCIMFSYALFGLMFFIGLFSLIYHNHIENLTRLSKTLLPSAILLLVVGVSFGSVWAANSWGAYWSWDPKEVWALITFLVYSVALHDNSLSFLRHDKYFHFYLIVAFLFVLMTFFGVNFLLGGMHSYI